MPGGLFLQGAILGSVIGLSFSLWMAIGAYTHAIHIMPRPFPTDNCPAPNATDTLTSMNNMTTVASLIEGVGPDYTVSDMIEGHGPDYNMSSLIEGLGPDYNVSDIDITMAPPAHMAQAQKMTPAPSLTPAQMRAKQLEDL